MKKLLLVVDDDPVFNKLLQQQLRGMGYLVRGAGNWKEAQEALKELEPAAIILDFKLPDTDAPRVLEELGGQYPVIVLTGYGSIRSAVGAIHQGASDYLTKPVNLDDLELSVRRVLENADLRRSNQFYKSQLASRKSGPLIGDSRPMRELQAMIDAVAPTDATVLILGESGSGKELVAQAIHERSPRAGRDLVTLDSTGFQENLFESELFGHERGAFTGADRQKKGLVEEAVGGSLFLDEIGDIGAVIQAKLLRVLETGTFRRLGGSKSLEADVRFITATNRDLAAMVEDGSFRSDLYFRLSAFVITVPPLRERREDIPALALHFLSRQARTSPMAIAEGAMKVLIRHNWPGNVRELKNAMERAVILARPGREIRAEHLAFIPKGDAKSVVLRFPHEPTFEEVEREYLAQVLERHSANRQKSAAVLGISERNIYRLIEKYGL